MYIVVYNYLGKSYAVEISKNASYYSLGVSRFSNTFYSIVAVGYMYGHPYVYQSNNNVNMMHYNRYFAKSARYENGKYYLQDYILTDSSGLSDENAKYYHYTCMGESSFECEEIGYVYNFYNRNIYFFHMFYRMVF